MYDRETVVVASDPSDNTLCRPSLLVSDGTHPFAGEQYIVAGISTKKYDDSVPLAASFIAGELARESFVSPWAVVSILESDIGRAVAKV
jgi:hypothetical protein